MEAVNGAGAPAPPSNCRSPTPRSQVRGEGEHRLLRCVLAQHQERPPTPARNEVAGIAGFAHAARDRHQGTIPCIMTEALVELLEVIDVDQQQSRARGSVGHPRFEALCGAAAVGEAGQGIGHADRFQPVLAAMR